MHLTPTERGELQAYLQKRNLPASIAQRMRIVLLLDEGVCSYTWLSASKSFAGTRDFYRTGRWNLAQTTPLDQNWNGLSVDVDEAKDDIVAFDVPRASPAAGAAAAATAGGEDAGKC